MSPTGSGHPHPRTQIDYDRGHHRFRKLYDASHPSSKRLGRRRTKGNMSGGASLEALGRGVHD